MKILIAVLLFSFTFFSLGALGATYQCDVYSMNNPKNLQHMSFATDDKSSIIETANDMLGMMRTIIYPGQNGKCKNYTVVIDTESVYRVDYSNCLDDEISWVKCGVSE